MGLPIYLRIWTNKIQIKREVPWSVFGQTSGSVHPKDRNTESGILSLDKAGNNAQNPMAKEGFAWFWFFRDLGSSGNRAAVELLLDLNDFRLGFGLRHFRHCMIGQSVRLVACRRIS